jgi:hypothetical protein
MSKTTTGAGSKTLRPTPTGPILEIPDAVVATNDSLTPKELEGFSQRPPVQIRRNQYIAWEWRDPWDFGDCTIWEGVVEAFDNGMIAWNLLVSSKVTNARCSVLMAFEDISHGSLEGCNTASNEYLIGRCDQRYRWIKQRSEPNGHRRDNFHKLYWLRISAKC